MIITKLQGGLGNQMFQYAAARNLSIHKKVYLDFSFLRSNNISTEHFTKRDFELGIFDIAFKEFTSKQKDKYYSKTFSGKILRACIYGEITVVSQQENEFVEFPSAKNIYLDGYFQSEKYFKNIRAALLKEFTFPPLDSENLKISKRIIGIENSVSIHVRRGDYMKPEVLRYHGILEENYYKTAVKNLQEKYSDLAFFIFSDDIDFSRKQFQDLENVSFVNINHGKDSWKDMCLMSQCRHHIIANSSFSWWGAWLCTKEGHTFAPENWFNKEIANFDIQNIIPENWILI